MDIWDRKERLDQATRAIVEGLVAWHGEAGDACVRCHVLVPEGFLLTLTGDNDTSGCLRCLETEAFLALGGKVALPDDLASVVSQQDALRQIAAEFRRQLKAVQRGERRARTPGSGWQARSVEGMDDDVELHNGWPRAAKPKKPAVKPRPTVKTRKAQKPIRQPSRSRAPTALERLGLSGEPGADEINAAFRRCALTCHPDHGGSVDAFRALIGARDALLAKVAERE